MAVESKHTTGAKGSAVIPGGVWALGFVSLFMDVSSEMIHSLLPIFLVSVLGASVTAVGVLEGVAEATALVTRIFSGPLSDALGKRKALAVIGYGMAAVTKPLFPLAGSYAVVFTARLIDRVGKGVRGAPRDALVADLVPESLRGASYGLRQSLDTVGALSGPLLATVFMLATGGDFRLVFWIAVLPAFVAVAVLIYFVREPPHQASQNRKRSEINWRELGRLPRVFWHMVIVGAIFTLARFSEAFIVLRARNIGLGIDYVPLVMVAMNIAYAASAYPAGRASDRMDRRSILAAGAVALIGADIVLAQAGGLAGLIVGVVLWGLHLGLTQGILAALVADTAPAERRGTAFGLFNLASGAVLLAASILAGELWDHVGPVATFSTGAILAGLALLGLLAQIRARPRRLPNDA